MPYMAPEQIQGRPGDHRSDLFSLGIILYELISGRRPFRGETTADLIASILKDEPVPLTDLDEKIPRSLWRIIKHALEKDPRRRFQAALDLRNELQEIVGEIGSIRREFRRSIAVLPFDDMRALGSTGAGDWVRAVTISSALPKYFCQTILGLPSMRWHSRA